MSGEKTHVHVTQSRMHHAFCTKPARIQHKAERRAHSPHIEHIAAMWLGEHKALEFNDFTLNELLGYLVVNF